jgi:hypothetical protein
MTSECFTKIKFMPLFSSRTGTTVIQKPRVMTLLKKIAALLLAKVYSLVS